MSECIYILLPVHNRKDVTQNFIESLQKQTWKNYHLVLIDDGSTDGTTRMVRDSITNAKLTVIRGEGNWWWAGCLQQGFNFLKEKKIPVDNTILIINDDVTFDENFITNGISTLERNNKSLLLAQFQEECSSDPEESGIHADLKKLSFCIASAPEKINCLSTRGLFLKWKDFIKIGGFYPIILPHYGSDYEFTLRAHRKGYGCLTSAGVTLSPNLDKTGRTEIDYSSYFLFLKSLFSRRTTVNPVYKVIFVCLVCPLKWIPGNILSIFIFTLVINIKYLIMKLKKMLSIITIKRNKKNR